MNIPTPPVEYVQSFCHSVIERVTSMLSDLNDKFLEIKELISKNEKNQLSQIEKILIKIDELKKLYYQIDKELFKVRSMSDLISKQSEINVDFSGNFKSIEKRLKIIFSIIFLGVSGFSALIFICMKIWLGGNI